MSEPIRRPKAAFGFIVGSRVQPTDEAFEAGLFSRTARPIRGTVTGFGLAGDGVRVRLDDRKSSSTYHHTFWKRAPR